MSLISIIMPVYNGEKFILAAIKSVIEQSYKHWELLVIDDCSTDNTKERVKSLNDSRIKLIEHSSHKGVSAARNTGLDNAQGSYIAFLDADDQWFHNKLQLQYTFLEEHSHIIATYCLLERINEHGNTIFYHSSRKNAALSLWDLALDNPIKCGSTLMFKKTQSTRFNEKLWMAEDLDFAITLLYQAQETLMEFPYVLCKYRLHHPSAGTNADFKKVLEQMQIIFNIKRREFSNLNKKQCNILLASNLLGVLGLTIFYNRFWANIKNISIFLNMAPIASLPLRHLLKLSIITTTIFLLPLKFPTRTNYQTHIFVLKSLFLLKNIFRYPLTFRKRLRPSTHS